MKINDSAPVLPAPIGPPPWLEKLAEDVTVEATVLTRPVEGKANVLALLKHAIPLYEFQRFTYRGDFGSEFFMESYRSQIRGVPIECMVLAHKNGAGEFDSLVINHRPLGAAILFSRLMGEQVGDRFGKGLYISAAEADALDRAKPPS